MTDDSWRGTGRTTRQMKAAPLDAIYVWCCGHLDYPRRLARDLGRDDLRNEPPSFFDCRWRSVRRPVIVDHAAGAQMTRRQLKAWEQCAAAQNSRSRTAT